MKKRILSIILTLCMVLMLVPTTAFADVVYYTITQNFKYGTRTYPGDDSHESPYTFEIPSGGSFGLATIEDCSPYELVGWKESVSETVYPPYGSIENLSRDLTFDAVYQVQGGLTITVDGFMPGKTPNDCTYTFESTIPGVIFSESDILDIGWQQFIFDGANYTWHSADSSTVFQADTAYWITISLNNKGLELVPSTTVNGIAPYDSEVVFNSGVPCAFNIDCQLGKPVAPTLAVTVDNFEVGKTPADITYSFASTNLDVTFSEEDILANGGSWKYYYGGEDEEWRLMSNTEVFEAGTRYWRTINLDNKGLTVAPAVTMNGKTPEVCYLATRDGTPYALAIGCELGTPAPAAITISGPDEVCAEQDYEFSATAAEGAEISYFHYRCGEYGGDTGWSLVKDGVYYGTVPASEYGDADSMVLTVYGTSANGKPATATKTVQISKEHIFKDGVCGCGAKEEYTLTVPFTTTVKQGGEIAPGETTFELAVIGDSAPDMDKSDVTITGSVTTNGAGDYDGTLTLTGPEETLWYMLSEGAFVQQVNAGEEGWIYDDTVWGLLLDEKGIALLSLEDESEYILNIYPTICEETDDGTVYYNLNQKAGTVEKMRFTNTYTKSTTKSAESNQNTGATKSSQTGDNSNLFLWIALLFVGGFGAVGIGVYSKRRRSSQAK